MRITSPTNLSVLTGGTSRESRGRRRKSLLQRINAYTLWAFNPQQELTSRYDRAA